MAVAFDAATFKTYAVNPSTTHTPVGNPSGVLIFLHHHHDDTPTVTYGGVSVAQVARIDSSAFKSISVYVRGNSIPSGAQTVAASGVTTDSGAFWAYTVTAAANTEFVNSVTIDPGNVVNPSATLNLLGRTSFVAEAFASFDYSSTSDTTPSANWTDRTESTVQGYVTASYSYDIINSANVTVGWTQASGQVTAIAAAISEVSGGGGGNTYYVSTNDGDDDDDGSEETPWETVRYAVSQLTAGDTLYLREGNYTGADDTIDSDLGTVPLGSPGSEITIAAYPGETVIIKPPDGQSAIKLHGTGTQSTSPRYLIFQDFTIDMDNQTCPGFGSNCPAGISLNGAANNNVFERLEVKNNTGNGIQFSNHNGDSPDNQVLDCWIHHISPDYGMYIFTSGNIIDGNLIENCGRYGIHAYNNSGAKDVHDNIIRKNIIRHNGQLGGNYYGLVVAWGADNQVYDNLIYGNPGGILIYTDADNTLVANNTSYANTLLGGLEIQFTTGTPTTVRNNIVFQNAGGDINDYDGTMTASNNLTTNPSFVDVVNDDFHLAAGSDAIDTGTAVGAVTDDLDGIARPQGAAYDIGCYEFTADGTLLAGTVKVALRLGTATASVTGGTSSLSTTRQAIALSLPTVFPVRLAGAQAILQARSGIARSGATRSNYYVPNVVLTLNGSNQSSSIVDGTLSVSLALNDEPDTASHDLKPGSTIPAANQTVKLSLGSASNPIFGGQVERVVRERFHNHATGPRVRVYYRDWLKLFDRRLITTEWHSESATKIAFDIIDTYTSGFTRNNIPAGLPTVTGVFPATNARPSQLMTRLVTAMGGGGWFIDADRDVHLFAGTAGETGPRVSPVPGILSNTSPGMDLQWYYHKEDGSQRRTKVIVEGKRTTCPISLPANADALLPGSTLPVADSTAFRSTGGIARVGSNRITYTANAYPVTQEGENSEGARVTATAAIGATSLSVDNIDWTFTTGTFWVQVGDQYLFYSIAVGGGSPSLSGIPATGIGSIQHPIGTGESLKALGMLAGVSGLTLAQPAGVEVVTRVEETDTTAAANLALTEGGDGIHEHLISDGRLSLEGATLRAQKELAAFSAPIQEAEWDTYNLTAMPGCAQPINLSAPDPIATTLTITRVDLEFPIPNGRPKRRCEAKPVKPAGFLDVMVTEEY